MVNRWISSVSIFHFTVSFLLQLLLPALYTNAQVENISFRHYTYENGLEAPVSIIKQDKYNFIWAGSTDGLYRFDGKYFVAYRNIPGNNATLPNNIINDLCVDDIGRVWAATNGGICYYDFSIDAFHTVDFINREKIDQHRVYVVAPGNHHDIWFATRSYLYLWNENKTVISVRIPGSNTISANAIYTDKKDRVWIGTNEGLFVYAEKENKFIHTSISSAYSRALKYSVTVHPVIPFHDDTLLIGSWYAGMQKVFLSGDSIYSIPFTDSSETDRRKNLVTGIAHGSENTWWIGTFGNGIAWFDSEKQVFTHHFHHNPSDERSLSSDYIDDIFTDASGIIWIGTSAGLDKFDPLTQQFRSVRVPFSPGGTAIYREPGTIIEDINDQRFLWITISGVGLYHYNRTNMQFTLYGPGKNDTSASRNNFYTVYYDDQERLWVGTRNGVFIFDEKSGKLTQQKAAGNLDIHGVHKILQDSSKRFWFATYSEGIYCYDEKKQTVTSWKYDGHKPNTLPDNRVFCMTQDFKGRIWIGTQNRGVCFLDPESRQFTYFEHDKKSPSSIPDNGIYDFYEAPDRHLWIATENGLAEMDLVTFAIKIYTTANGLCNNDIFSIMPDSQNHLWLGTNNGFSNFDPSRNFFKNYYTNDGLPTNHISGGVCLTADGTLFFGTPEMLSYCNPGSMKMNKRIPPIVITDFRIFDRKAPIKRIDGNPEPIALSYKQNMITFDFAALNFTNTSLNQYAYQLEGFDHDWIYCGNKQSATYTNLDGGNYMFRVKAANNDGIWNETGASVRLSVSTPFWKTWWFYALCIAMTGGILYLVYRARIRQLMALQHIRMRISRDLHDDIGSTLSSINMISSMANRNGQSGKSPAELFGTISAASRQAMELMNDIVWSINPKNDRMDMIIVRMRQYASEMLEAANISFILDMDEQSKGVTLSIEKRKDLYLIFKEAINNLAKYARANQAQIKISYSRNLLILTITDNGIGFTPGNIVDKLKPGNGLKNMHARACQHKGEFEIISEPGAGTTVKLKIPVLP